MKFGVFDQNDASGRPLVQQYEERLSLASLYEESGFFCYHMSEHHGTDLSTTPSPSVFLAAMSQRTKTLKIGPLVYLLPGYDPLRLTEEIGMLDTLSNGRMLVGVGRGASPHEMGYLGVQADQVSPMYAEALEIIRNGLTEGVVNHSGQFWQYDQVHLSIPPVQRPHPPLWIAIGSPDSAVWPARNGANIVVGGPAERARLTFSRYLEELAKNDTELNPDPLMGINRHVVVADTDEEAYAIADRAWRLFYAHFISLWRRHGGAPANRMPENFADVHAAGSAIVGSPATVRDTLTKHVETSGANFLSGTFVFGDMTDAEARHSIGLFAKHVMAPVKDAAERAHARLCEAA